jgi:hypothetical protein
MGIVLPLASTVGILNRNLCFADPSQAFDSQRLNQGNRADSCLIVLPLQEETLIKLFKEFSAPGKVQIALVRHRPESRRLSCFLLLVSWFLKQFCRVNVKEAAELQAVIRLRDCLPALPATDTFNHCSQGFSKSFLRKMAALSFLSYACTEIHRSVVPSSPG